MGLVSLDINGQRYQLSCEDGQEAGLEQLGEMVRQKVEELNQSVGKVGEQRLLLMAAILLANDVQDLRQGGANGPGGGNGSDRQAAVAEAVESCARRLERLAARFEAA